MHVTRLALAAVLATGIPGIVVAESVTTDANGVRVSIGADYVSPPSIPDVFYLDARTRPIVAAWKPGDPVREIPRLLHGDKERQNVPTHPVNAPEGDPLVKLQNLFGSGLQERTFTTPLVDVEGQGYTGVFPPDPSGDVGGGYYVQSINSSGGAVFTIYNTADGSVAAGPFNMDGLGSGGACATGLGDGVVVFDQLANRWVLTEFSTQSGRSLCVYLSADSNPVTTTWTRYVFQPPSFPDYPKYGVWPDAYYVGANEGPAVYALDRTNMLAGNPATFQRKSVPSLSGLGFQMTVPATADGITPPPAGAPGMFVRQNDDERNNPGSNDPAHDFIELFKLHVDFATPANTALTGPIQIAESEFDSEFDVPSGFGAIHQPGTTQLLDPLLEVVMMPFHYRNFGSYETLVGNHVTKLNSADDAGVRWFELRRTGGVGGSWALNDEGTYAPTDPNGQASRWMGSIAMDEAGNMALGYAIDRATGAAPLYPGLSYTGRLAGDPAGVMTSAETPLVAGGSSQTNADRWGDYFHMAIDPADGCTFWFTGQYMPPGGNWSTRIGSFKFDACGTPTFGLSGNNLAQQVCADTGTPTALTPIDINVASINGYNTAVTMGFGSGLPTGFAGSYTVSPVTPPGTTQANLSATNAATPGSNAITLRGSSSGTDRDLALSVDVSTQIPPLATLTSPANGATGIATHPTFSWTASTQATTYLIEIATDAAFSNVIVSQTVTGTNFQPSAALPNDTDLYWRVSAANVCGDTGPSAAFSFHTLPAPGQCVAGDIQLNLFSDDMENGVGAWTTNSAQWTQSTTRANSPTHSWFAPDQGAVSDLQLTSPTIALPGGAVTGLNLQFDHWYDIEQNSGGGCYDGAILEMSIDGGSFTQVPGTLLAADPYTGTVSTLYSNPIGGQDAWCGAPGAFNHVIVDLTGNGNHNVQFRFRIASDNGVSKEGWYVDDVTVKGCEPDLIFADEFEASP